ncbi:hypothetical protein GIB67_028801 [Kingdonia uniflora]|uniref:Uncharacterized protein n=1 Tax=Kingdonia uniflora TaxID=39325 RepID=A0A7J7LBD7_9MAGN|nr:hypothetical protein GIB67_028801 [Kingdonia uniflora]
MAKDFGSRRWQYSSAVRGELDSTADSHSDTEGVKSIVERKESLFDEVAEEEVELKLVLEGLSLSRKKRVDSRSNKGIWLGIEEEKSELKKAKRELEKELDQAKTEAMKEVRQLKASYVVAIGQLQVEAKANLDEMVEEHDRLGRHLMLKGYTEEEVDAIKADTNVEEGDDEEAEAVGVVDSLDGISHQTLLDNHGDNIELPEGGSEKVVRDMSLRINDLESGLSKKRGTSEALLSAQAELRDRSE